MKSVVLFDVDNTLLDGYSQQIFLKYAFKKGLIKKWPYIKINLWFGLYKLNIIKDPKPIMEYAYRFARDWSKSDMRKLISDFFNDSLGKPVFREARTIFRDHGKRGKLVVLVSNSVEPILEKLAEDLGLRHYLGTKLELVDGHYTGKISGDIIYGQHKPPYLKKYLAEHKMTLDDSWCYSDHISDLPLFNLCNHCVAVNPSKKLLSHALKEGWKVMLFN